MSWRATAANKGIRTGVPRTEKLLLMCLADYPNDESGACFPSVPTLARDTLMCARHTTRVLSSLAEKGLILIERADGRSSNYVLLCIQTPDMVSPLTNLTPDIAMSPTPDMVSGTPDIAMSPTPDIAMSYEPSYNRHKEPKGTAIPHVSDFLKKAREQRKPPQVRVSRRYVQ